MTLLESRERALPRVSPSAALRYRSLIALVGDSCAVAAASATAAMLRRYEVGFGSGGEYAANQAALALPVVMLVWLATIAVLGGYSSRIFDLGTEEFRRVLLASVAAAGLLSAICFLVGFRLSRGFFLLAFATGVPTRPRLAFVRSLLRPARPRARLAPPQRPGRWHLTQRRRRRARAAARAPARLPRGRRSRHRPGGAERGLDAAFLCWALSQTSPPPFAAPESTSFSSLTAPCRPPTT